MLSIVLTVRVVVSISVKLEIQNPEWKNITMKLNLAKKRMLQNI